MEEINAHPGIYTGAVINLTWLQLEPSQNVFDDSALESAIANINAYNAKYPATPVTGKIRISAGTGTPPWVWDLTGGPITVASSACSGLTCVTNAPQTMQIGAFWQPVYINAWRALIQHLASEYDTNPIIQEVAISSCSSKTDEPFVVNLDWMSVTNMRAFGYSDAAYQSCLMGAQEDYAPWVNTPIEFTFFPFFTTDSCTSAALDNCETADENFTNQVMNSFRASLGTSRGVVANEGLHYPLSAEFNGTLIPLYAAFQTLYQEAQAQNPPSDSPLEFETSAFNVDWDGTVQLGLNYHPTELEVWDTTAAGGPAVVDTTQLQTYAALLTGVGTTPTAGPHLVSAASLQATAASESLVSVFGSGMADNGTTTVTITDSTGMSQQAQTIYVSPNQINAVVPAGVATGATIVTVSPPNNSITGYFNTANVAPGIFTANEGGSGVAAAEILTVNSDGTSSSTYSFTCSSNGCTASPVNVSVSNATVYLVLYGTGFRNRSALSNTSVQIGTQTVVPTYAGAQNQFVGLDQINVPIPASLAHAGVVNVTFTADNMPSNTVTVQIQ